MREIYVQYACNIRAICIKNYCILHTKSTDEAAYFAFKFSSICTKNLPNMHAKFDLKCINFKCILQSRKTVGYIEPSALTPCSKQHYIIEPQFNLLPPF